MDFTLRSYDALLRAVIKSYGMENIITFNDYFSKHYDIKRFLIIRHDVDRKPKNALKMALKENELGVRSTYYFRAKQHTFNPEIILQIKNLGHEIGYHYESLSDTNGNIEKALIDFEYHLNSFREFCQVSTISMHGRPFKNIDNRDLWRTQENEDILKKEYKIIGEVYLNIDYKDIAYINDTGRNWSSSKDNKRDTVKSEIKINIKSNEQLLKYFLDPDHNKIIFSTHPERWTDNKIEYFFQFLKDKIINYAKIFFNGFTITTII